MPAAPGEATEEARSARRARSLQKPEEGEAFHGDPDAVSGLDL